MSAPAEPLTVVPAISLHLRDRVRLHSSAPVLGRKNTSRRSRQPETYEAIVKVIEIGTCGGVADFEAVGSHQIVSVDFGPDDMVALVRRSGMVA